MIRNVGGQDDGVGGRARRGADQAFFGDRFLFFRQLGRGQGRIRVVGVVGFRVDEVGKVRRRRGDHGFGLDQIKQLFGAVGLRIGGIDRGGARGDGFCALAGVGQVGGVGDGCLGRGDIGLQRIHQGIANFGFRRCDFGAQRRIVGRRRREIEDFGARLQVGVAACGVGRQERRNVESAQVDGRIQQGLQGRFGGSVGHDLVRGAGDGVGLGFVGIGIDDIGQQRQRGRQVVDVADGDFHGGIGLCLGSGLGDGQITFGLGFRRLGGGQVADRRQRFRQFRLRGGGQGVQIGSRGVCGGFGGIGDLGCAVDVADVACRDVVQPVEGQRGRAAARGGHGDAVGNGQGAAVVGDGDFDRRNVISAGVVLGGDQEGVGRAVAVTQSVAVVQFGNGGFVRGVVDIAVGAEGHFAKVAVADAAGTGLGDLGGVLEQVVDVVLIIDGGLGVGLVLRRQGQFGFQLRRAGGGIGGGGRGGLGRIGGFERSLGRIQILLHAVGGQRGQAARGRRQAVASAGGDRHVVGNAKGAAGVGDRDSDDLQIKPTGGVLDRDLEAVGGALTVGQRRDLGVVRIDGVGQRPVGIRRDVALVAVAGALLNGFGAFGRIFEGVVRGLGDRFVDQLGQKVRAGFQNVVGGLDRLAFFCGRRCLGGGGRGLLRGQVGLRRAVFVGLRRFARRRGPLDRRGRFIRRVFSGVGVFDRPQEFFGDSRINRMRGQEAVECLNRLSLQAVDRLRGADRASLGRQHGGRVGRRQGRLGVGCGLVRGGGGLNRQVQNGNQLARQVRIAGHDIADRGDLRGHHVDDVLQVGHVRGQGPGGGQLAVDIVGKRRRGGGLGGVDAAAGGGDGVGLGLLRGSDGGIDDVGDFTGRGDKVAAGGAVQAHGLTQGRKKRGVNLAARGSARHHDLGGLDHRDQGFGQGPRGVQGFQRRDDDFDQAIGVGRGQAGVRPQNRQRAGKRADRQRGRGFGIGRRGRGGVEERQGFLDGIEGAGIEDQARGDDDFLHHIRGQSLRAARQRIGDQIDQLAQVAEVGGLNLLLKDAFGNRLIQLIHLGGERLHGVLIGRRRIGALLTGNHGIFAGARRGRQIAQNAAVLLLNLLRRDDDRRRRRQVDGGDGQGRAGLVQDHRPGVVRDDDFADEVTFGQDCEVALFAFRRGAPGQGRAANPDGRGRRVDEHVVRAGLGNLTRDERERALHDRGAEGAALRDRVIDHFVQDHAAVIGKGERGFVGEFHADRAQRAGFDDVALVNRVADLQLDLGAVGAGRFDLAGNVDDLADRLVSGGGAGLGFLTRRGGAGQLKGEFALDDVALRGNQIGRIGQIEIVLDKDLGAVLADQHEVGALAHEFGLKNPPAVRHVELLGPLCVQHERVRATPILRLRPFVYAGNLPILGQFLCSLYPCAAVGRTA